MFLARFFLLFLKGGAATAFMVTPSRQELGGELIVLVPHYLPNEGKLPLSDLVSNRGDVEESRADGAVRDSVVDYLSDGNSQNFSYVPVEEHL